MSDHVYIARQPIVTADNEVFGYELLFRSLQKDGSISVGFADEMIATTRVVVNTLNHIGLQEVVGQHRGFINVDAELLLDDILLSFPKDRFVIELLEHIEMNDKIIQRVKQLKELGYKIALDDAHCDPDFIENFASILPLLDILKLDVAMIEKNKIEDRLEQFRQLECKLLAEKVETKEEFEYYKALGCTLFQGYFFAKPDIIKKAALDPTYKRIFKLINILDQDGELYEISSAFEQSPEITMQLLRFMNSGILGLQAKIRSISHAITLLGKKPLKQWLLLIAFSKSDNQGDQGFHSPLLELAQSRGKLMSELMKKFSKDPNASHEAALVGVLSLIDAVTNTSMDVILAELHMDEDIENALLKHQGELGTLLSLAQSIEAFDIEQANFFLENLNLSHQTLEKALLESYKLKS